jgi:hypothetical protein
MVGADSADPAPPSTAKRVRILFDDDPDDPNKRRSVLPPTDTNEQASTPAQRPTKSDVVVTPHASVTEPSANQPSHTSLFLRWFEYISFIYEFFCLQ